MVIDFSKNDLKHNADTSTVTFGLLSYITPITPIGIVTFEIFKPFDLRHFSKVILTGSFNLMIVLNDLMIFSFLFH